MPTEKDLSAQDYQKVEGFFARVADLLNLETDSPASHPQEQQTVNPPAIAPANPETEDELIADLDVDLSELDPETLAQWRDKLVPDDSDPEAVVALERWLSQFSPPPPEPETEVEVKPQTTPVPLSTPPFVAPLVTYLGQRSERESSPKRRKKGWKWLLLGLGLVVVGWTVYDAFKPRLRRLESQVTQAWAANSELGVYRLDAEFEGDILQLTGKLPNRDLRDRAAKIAQDAVPGQLIDNDIIVVDRFVDEEVQQIAQTLNLLAGVDITARFEGGTAILTGTAMQPLDLDSISQSFEQVAGVQAVDNQVEIQQSAIATRIYFGQNATELKPVDIDVKIAPIAQLLRRYPQFKLKILGYGHASETNPDDLARQRSQAVQTILEDQGVDRRRLSAIASADLPPNITANQDRWLARCVVFELIETSPSTP